MYLTQLINFYFKFLISINYKVITHNFFFKIKKLFTSASCTISTVISTLKYFKKLNVRSYIGLYLNISKWVLKQFLYKIVSFTFKHQILLNQNLFNFDFSIKKNGNLFCLFSTIINKLVLFFNKFGFSLIDGKEIITDGTCFDLLNTPPYHPIRTSSDTFYLMNNLLKLNNLVLRTQTSSTQIKALNNCKKLPLKVISYGRVFRNDRVDATHNINFYQFEGLYISKYVKINFLKKILIHFLRKIICHDVNFRFRSSFFPFTVPSFEIDVFDKNSKEWIELLGCGMIHPKVLKLNNVNYKVWNGFAFGIGIERLIMLKYNIRDLRNIF